MAALELGNPQPAVTLLQNRPNPRDRTPLIDAFPQRAGRWEQIAAALSLEDDADFRSGICIGLGSLAPKDVPSPVRKTLQKLLSEWYRSASRRLVKRFEPIDALRQDLSLMGD